MELNAQKISSSNGHCEIRSIFWYMTLQTVALLTAPFSIIKWNQIFFLKWNCHDKELLYMTIMNKRGFNILFLKSFKIMLFKWKIERNTFLLFSCILKVAIRSRHCI